MDFLQGASQLNVNLNFLRTVKNFQFQYIFQQWKLVVVNLGISRMFSLTESTTWST